MEGRKDVAEKPRGRLEPPVDFVVLEVRAVGEVAGREARNPAEVEVVGRWVGGWWCLKWGERTGDPVVLARDWRLEREGVVWVG